MLTVGDGEDSMTATDRVLQGLNVIKICLDDFYALLLECLSSGLARIASYSSQLVALRQGRMAEDCLDNAATLPAGGAEHGQQCL